MDWKKRLIRTALLGLVGIVIGGIFGYMQHRNQNYVPAGNATQNSTQATTQPLLNVAGVGGPFTLTDHTGKLRTQADFENTYSLIYFGFTFCPAICPTELQKMTLALNMLGTDADKVQPIFITVDPERDTQKNMASYVTLFHPRLLGLRGTEEQTDQVKKSYKVYAAKVPPAEGSADDEYLVDHTSFLYFMGPDDTGEQAVLALFRTEDTADMMAEVMRGFLKRQ